MAIFPGTSITPAGAAGGYTIDQSLRFEDGSSAYLSRTPASAGNRKTWTWSGWVKRGNLGTRGTLFTADSGANSIFEFNSNDTFNYVHHTGSVSSTLTTTQVFRDPSAWYHIVVVSDTTHATSSERSRLYINGSRVTSFSTEQYPAQNADGKINAALDHYMFSHHPSNSIYYDGYGAEVHFIDGQALTPDSFGEVDETYGHWKPIRYTGTYGTNGFYLPFSGTFYNDASGNGNNWTANNLATTDVVLDSPTNNFCTWNPLDERNQWNAVPTADYSGTFAEGNLKWTSPSCTSYSHNSTGTFWVDSGKWYWEGYMVSDSGGQASFQMASAVNGSSYDKFYTGNISAGTTVGIKVDLDSNSIQYTTDGTNYSNMTAGGGNTYSLGAVPLTPMFQLCSSVAVANFGQDSSFAGNKTAQNNTDSNGYGDFYYAPPSGFLALCTANLPDPAVVPGENFEAIAYAGSASEQTLEPAGFAPDFTWIKARNKVEGHCLFDRVRGSYDANYLLRLVSNSTASEGYGDGKEFTSTGITLVANSGGSNASGYNYVAWNWKADNTSGSTNTDGSITSAVAANVDAGFSIVSYTGNATAGATVGHGLSQVPDVVILKNRSSAGYWSVFGPLLSGAGTNDEILHLNTADAQYNPGSDYWNGDTPISSSVITFGAYDGVNGSGENYIAYAFHSVDGYSKFGSYTGNGSSDGVFVYTGFRPAFVMVKRADSANSWFMYDTEREAGQQPLDDNLYADLSNAEASANTFSDFLSNGFKLRAGYGLGNASGGTYIYMAFAEYPFKYTNAR